MSSAGLSTTAPEGVVAQSGVAGNVGDDPPSSVPFAGTQVCNPVLSPTGVASTPLKSTLSTIDPHLSCVAEEEIGIISWNAQMFQDDCVNNHIGRYLSNGTEGDSLSRIEFICAFKNYRSLWSAQEARSSRGRKTYFRRSFAVRKYYCGRFANVCWQRSRGSYYFLLL